MENADVKEETTYVTLLCLRYDRVLDRGQGTPEGWLCSGCRNVGPINNNLGNVQGTFSNEFPGVELMGVFGTMTFSGPQCVCRTQDLVRGSRRSRVVFQDAESTTPR